MPNLIRPVKITGMYSNSKFNRRLIPALVVAILAIAAVLRFYNINWDNGIFPHPDERSTVAFYAPTIRWPNDPSTLLDPRASTLNPFWDAQNQTPRSYTYGHFPLYALVLVANLLYDLAPLATSLELSPGLIRFLSESLSMHGFAQIGRALVALADLGTVYLVFLLGRRLYGTWAGLLAAALSAFTVLQIQLAHFFAVDPISTTFTLLALYGAILIYDRRSTGAAILAGVGIGLAVASKFSALPVAFAPVVAAYLAVSRGQPSGDTAAGDPPNEDKPVSLDPSQLTKRMISLAVVALGTAFILFVVTSPFVLLDFENFRRAVLVEQGNMVRGIADMPFTRQYRGTPAYWYFIKEQLRWGMGWPLGLLGLGGLVWVVVKAIRGKARPGEWIILWWIILYFGPTGLFLAKFMRYMVPVVPLFVLFGAGMVVALWRLGDSLDEKAKQPAGEESKEQESGSARESENQEASQQARLAKGAAIAIATIALVSAAFWSLAFVNGVYGTEHTWTTASRWIYANVPDGACIAREHWEEGLPADITRLQPRGNAGAYGYSQPQLPMYDPDTPQKYEFIRDTLTNCDYLVLASNRLWRTIPRLPERYPMSTRYYEALFSGQLGFEPVYTGETPPRLGPFEFDDQAADESFTVYDHPKPIVFKKTRQLSAAEWNNILGGTWVGAVHGYVSRPTLLMRLSGFEEAPTPAAIERQAIQEESNSLLLERPVDQLPEVDDFRWNSLANNSTVGAILVWWLAVTLIGIVTWPLTFLLFHKLPDRGYGLSRSLGLLLVGYFVWINSSLGGLGNRLSTVIVGVVLLAGFGLWAAVKQRHHLIRFLGQQRRLILISEAVFTLVYLFFIYLRLLNPDLWQPWLGGEKMLEIGFLNAIVKSAQMPPYDPFFAGGIINYYYYGLFLVGTLIKLTGIRPAIAFNLAVPTLAGLTAVNAFSLAGNLTTTRSPFARLGPKNNIATPQSPIPNPQSPIPIKQVASGLLAVLFILFIGNLEGAAQFMRQLAQLSLSDFQSAIPGFQTLVLSLGGLAHLVGGETIASYNYWDPTRVIPNTINEFPYFSFLFADLHPHMIGIPFTILFLSLAYNWLRPDQLANDEGQTAPSEPSAFTYSPIRSFARWLALPFVLGAVAIINTWDMPTYLGLIFATFLLSHYRRLKEELTLKQIAALLAKGIVFAGALVIVTYLLYRPFFINYQAIDVGLGLVHTQTALDQHLKIWGFFLLIILSWLGVSLLYPGARNGLLRAISLGLRRWNVWPHLSEIYRRLVKQRERNSYRLALAGIGGTLFIAVVLAVGGYRVPAYLFPLVVLALVLLLRSEVAVETTYIGLLIFTGLLILLGVEFFFLRDWLGGGDAYRMNTLFKFFIQVWILFGLAAGVILPQLWDWAWRWSWPAQLAWRGAVILLLMASLIYPLLGTRTRLDDRFPGDFNRPAIGTLDGLAYMTVGEFEWPAGRPIELRYDYEAIRWLQKNVEGTPVIAEAKVGYYREGGMRVAAYTGLPSVMGNLHQSEQRYASQVGARDFLVSELWSTPDPDRTLELLDQLDVTYIYVGQIERITHGDYIGEKFEQLRQQGALELVFENEKTKIYKIVK